MVPSDPLDRSLPGRHARSEPGIRYGVASARCSPPPGLPGCGSKLRRSPALRPGRSLPLDAAFHSPAAKSCLAAVPAAGSTLLAYIFETAPAFPLARSASRSRPRPAFYSPGGARSWRVARCRLTIPEPCACLRTSAPLQDVSILRDPSTLPARNRRNLPSRVARSAFTPRRVAITNYYRATDQRSSSATSRLARCPSNLLEPSSSCTSPGWASSEKMNFPQSLFGFVSMTYRQQAVDALCIKQNPSHVFKGTEPLFL